ncbi:MAG: hypothetical protein UX09_C0034G0001 [Candidatus Uhrbacteria bacterium GW2011_GWE2_45_35]|uniref:Uncharacterized protein n=1 Tax=Candidatus Uhrbacteria bacterium GW2011_GWE2_45_35 TaxID=1618993 RepID=A0A0G1MFQ1_9BACT|nr:MAG: hypothetical protein UX09_C0034G0001 [Candidatus Uhrbacteria bacterium GW2011_GWE2_45_35]
MYQQRTPGPEAAGQQETPKPDEGPVDAEFKEKE